MSANYNFVYYLEPTLTPNVYTIVAAEPQTTTVEEFSGTDLRLDLGEPARVTLGDGSLAVGNFQGTVGTDGAVFSFTLGPFDTALLSNTGGLATGTTITIDSTEPLVVCFLPGTLVATPAGEVAVEALAIGDPVLTADGRSVPIRWIGRQTVVTLFGPPENRAPVVIEAGALAEGMPHTDLRVTADHALILDGIAVNAGALVNGTTIRRIPRAELGARYTVFHIETENHEVILANGAPAETFVDNVTRARFDNFAEYLALCGEELPIEEMPLPRATAARQVPRALRARIATRAERATATAA